MRYALPVVTVALAWGGLGLQAQQSPRVHIDRSGVVEIALSPDSAFVLFQPEGERRWASGWSPQYLFANGPRHDEGTVFTTDSDGRVAVWIVTASDHETGHISYVNLIPDVRVTQVSVNVEGVGPRHSRALVRYRMTSLSRSADDDVRGFAAGFDVFLTHWEEAIDAHLVRGVPVPPGEAMRGGPPRG